MADKINPDALAQTDDSELDARPGVQEVTEEMIFAYVVEELEALPTYSARPFAAWLDHNWYSFNEEGANTVGDVITGALADWRGL
jgi:hypothetical protein